MNRNAFKMLLLIIVSAAIPQANAQYAGRMPSDSIPLASPENPFASTSTPLNAKAVAAAVPGAVPAAPVSALKPMVHTVSTSSIAAPKGSTQVINPSSAKLTPSSGAPDTASPIAVSSFWRYSYMKAPAGSKKGHWQDAPVYSMMGMPTWVEDK